MPYKILTRWSKNAYNKADIITCSSKSFKNYFINELKLSEEKKFIYMPSYAESLYDNCKTIKNKKFDLLFAGNIGPAQSVETIIEAANLLKDEKDIMFHIVGDGLSKLSCEEQAKKYGLENVKFYGYHSVDEMKEYYELADAFLITMVDNEVVNSTLPAKVQSYMLAGKPIIGAISGEVKNVIKEADCGLCCESLDYVEFAKIIKEAYKSDKKEKWSNNSYKYYKDNFEKDKCIDDIINLFKKTIKNK